MYHALKLDKDVRIPMRNGAYVVADVFRPDSDGRLPIIMTMGPYSKDIRFRDCNPSLDYEHLPERGLQVPGGRHSLRLSRIVL